MESRERVLRAIVFERPDRVPVWFFNREPERGDIAYFVLALGDEGRSEWGYTWVDLGDGTMGQPDEPVFPTFEDAFDADLPPLRRAARVAEFAAFARRAGDRYRLAGLGLTGFTAYTFLRGFENAMLDFAATPEDAGRLLDRVMAFENDLIDLAADLGMDGVHFQDDWGTQQGLIISPTMWRDLFKPRYRAQFDHAHSRGLQVWFHCCGNILKIVSDLHEIGVNVLNISQPNVVDIGAVGRDLCGRQCFMVPISYQTVSVAGSPADIAAEADRLHRALAAPEGGFIGYVEDYRCMGMSEGNYQACADAFLGL